MRIDCTPVPEARIEFWRVNADGNYDDDHRATVVADERGRYRLDTTRPVAYGGGPIRIREQLFEWPAPGDAVLATDGITGAFGLRDDGTFAEGSLLHVPLVTLKSDDSRRADAARETMNADRFRDATVKPIRATGLTLPLPASGTFTFTLESLMTVNGFEREVRWDVTADRSGRDLSVRARTAFKFGLFGMEPPRRGPVLSIVDEIRMEIELGAKARG